MTLFEANQFFLKYIARFIQDFRVRGSNSQQSTEHRAVKAGSGASTSGYISR